MNKRHVQEIRHWPRSVRHRYGNDATLIHDYDERLENAENIFLPMHVITRKRLNEFAEEHPESRTALVQWFALAKRNTFSTFAVS